MMNKRFQGFNTYEWIIGTIVTIAIGIGLSELIVWAWARWLQA